MPTSEVSLEDVLAEHLEKILDSQNHVLALRNYFRWEIVSQVLEKTEGRNLAATITQMHLDKGKSIRDITAHVNKVMQSMLTTQEKRTVLTEIVSEFEEFLQRMTNEDSDLLASAIHGSPHRQSYDLIHFLTVISKNAITRITKDLGITSRNYSQRHEGKGYKEKKRGQTGAQSQSRWDNPESRRVIETAIQEAWDNNSDRKAAAAKRAKEQLKLDPGKLKRASRARAIFNQIPQQP